MSDKETFSGLKREQWDAFDYGSWFVTPKGKLVDYLEKRALKRAINNENLGHILDVGVANGRQVFAYHEQVKQLTAIDISSRQLEDAKKNIAPLNLQAEFVVCNDASKLDFPDATFDTVICTRVIQHLHDWKAGVNDFYRVLKPGGRVILITYNRWSVYGIGKLIQHWINPHKGHFRNPISLSNAVNKAGFKVEHYEGAMLGQPSVYPNFLIKVFKGILKWKDNLSNVPPFKFFGERLIIVGRKIS